ncbi:MAG: DUF5106 domain-containing protein [Bacteroidales bacterium]|nr:DUF5106 domain-containing protein [Bacteroidales bacterium]
MIRFSMLFFILIILLVGSVNTGFAQKDYKIKIELEGAPDTVLYLANYYGDKTYLKDTAYIDKHGQFLFEGDSILPAGIYILAGQSNNKYFELIVDHYQHFALKAELKDMISTSEIKNSPENELFFAYIRQSMKTSNQIEQLKTERKEYQKEEDGYNRTGKKINKLEIKLKEYKDSLALANPGTLLAGIINAMKEIKPDSIPLAKNGLDDSLFAYNFYKDHYWDNFDLTDDRLLRTPLFHHKLETYFGKVLYQVPDTIITEADKIIDMARPNKETFRYIVWYLTFKFETSKVMGFDEIFVHMVDNYYAKGEAYWADSSLVKSLSKRSQELHNVLIGHPAKDLILLDTNERFKSLYREEAPYMVVLFYEYDCGHCRREIDALKKWYDNNEIGFQVFAVCTDTSLTKWKEFVKKKNLTWINVNGTRSVTPDYHQLYDINITPTIFLLDDKKKILAKRIKTDQLKPFLENYHKAKQRNN